MNPDGHALEDLPRSECLRLLASVRVGRIVYTSQALPAVAVVNFAVDEGGVVFRSDGSGNLEAATQHAVVAFEVDELDAATRSGWSVTIVGPADEVTDAGEIAGLHMLALDPWAPGGKEHFIRIKPELVSGRRILPAA